MINLPDQPDGIDGQSLTLPEPADAARRVQAFVEEFGDGLITHLGPWETASNEPVHLFARDLAALLRVVHETGADQ